MRVERQLSLILENRPGVLAEVCSDLGEAGIDIEAIYVENLVDHSVVRMVVSEPDKAIHLLGSAGVLVFENEVMAIPLPDKPGSLARLAERLGKARVNIDYLYASQGAAKGKATIVLRVDDLKRARAAVQGKRSSKTRP
jgi:hypothetical protein